ncbi:YigZ family protein [Fluctibacter corallii]|uniref:YigZ family protein n=1 Tax=Fluctibacter corallii TaxID=2984329 RepID=UPI00384B7F11
MEEEIKRSRFITYVAHTPSIASAKAFVEHIKHIHSDARHNCWAFNAGAPNSTMLLGCSDDGEPSGTAGRPMLAQLCGSDVGEITAVCARYFGGTKLGTGGLVKAYGGGVKLALSKLETKVKIPMTAVSFECSYQDQNIVDALLNETEHEKLNTTFNSTIIMDTHIESASVAQILDQIKNATQGRVMGKVKD